MSLRHRWLLGFAAGLVVAVTILVALAMSLRPDAAGRSSSRHHHHEIALPSGTAADADCRTARSEFEREMDHDMAVMMRDMHAPGYTGDADVDFLAMMIPHHQGAVDMARLVLTHGGDPLTRRLAEEIIASQRAEIAAMEARLAILRQGPDPEPGGFPALSGTRGR